MMWALKFAGSRAIRFLAPVAIGLAVAAIILWQVVGYAHDVRDKAVTERDIWWQAQIAKSTAQAERAQSEQLAAALAAQEDADNEINRLEAELKLKEIANETLAGGSECGLDPDHVRLLPQ